jgi:hypothetical protein
MWRQIEALPQPPKSHLATPLPRTRRVFAAQKWSPLDVRFMPRGTDTGSSYILRENVLTTHSQRPTGIGNNLEEAIPPPVSSHEFAPLVQFLYPLPRRYLKGSPIGTACPKWRSYQQQHLTCLHRRRPRNPANLKTAHTGHTLGCSGLLFPVRALCTLLLAGLAWFEVK